MLKSIFVVLLLICSFQIQSSYAQCGTPTNLQFVYANNVSTFSWDAVPGATSYYLELKYPSYSWSNLEYATVVNSNSLSLTGVMQSIALDWRVQAVCSSGSSSFAQSSMSIPCPVPHSLQVTNLGNHSATLNWAHDPGYNTMVSDFLVAYRAIGNSTWISLGNTFATTINVSNLQSGTSYEWRVMQTCAYFNSSYAYASFTTSGPACAAVTGLTTNSVNATQASISWNVSPNAISYQVEYKPSTATTWSSPVNAASNSTTLNNLTPGTTYTWRVISVCPSGTNTSVVSNFTTTNPTSCGIPQGLQIVSASNTSLTLGWTPVQGATSYQLRYRLLGSSGWNIVSGIAGTSYAINNLNIGATYETQLRSVCTSGYSSYTASLNASTTLCISAGNNTNEWIDRFVLGSIQRNSGAEPGGYLQTGIQTTLVRGTNHQGQISAGFSGTTRKQNYAVYVDFNDNGNFNDAGERIFGSGLISNGNNFNFNATIPANAALGVHAMRVIMRRNGGPSIQGCLENFLGETEDYQVEVVANSNRPAELNAQDAGQNKLFVAPNPSSGLFQVSTSSEIISGKYLVRNIQGSVIQQGLLNQTTHWELNLSNHRPGIYFLEVHDGSLPLQVYKLLKQE